MSLVLARYANLDTNSFVTGQDTFEVRLDPAGNLTKTANGLAVQVDLQDGRGTLNPATGTIALPTTSGAETTVNNGTVYDFGDYYLVTSAGTVGATHVVSAAEVPALLIYNGTNTAGDALGQNDADWSLVKGTDTSTLAPQTRNLTAGAGMVGGGDLTADRTFDVAATDATITVAADGIKVNPDQLENGGADPLDWQLLGVVAADTYDNFTPTTTGTNATATTQLGAIIAGIDDALAPNVNVETFTITAGQITGGITLSGTPSLPNNTVVEIAGAGSQVLTDDYTVAGAVVSFTAAVQSMLSANDRVRIQWQ